MTMSEDGKLEDSCKVKVTKVSKEELQNPGNEDKPEAPYLGLGGL